MRTPLVSLLFRQASRIRTQQHLIDSQAHLIAGLTTQCAEVGRVAEQAVYRCEQLAAQVEMLMITAPDDLEELA